MNQEISQKIEKAKQDLATEDVSKFPSVFQMGRNLAKQIWLSGKGVVAGDGFLANAEKVFNRLSICESCEFFRDKRCLKCGCFMEKKAHLEKATCPMDKWGENTGLRLVNQVPTPKFDITKFPENERLEMMKLAEEAAHKGIVESVAVNPNATNGTSEQVEKGYKLIKTIKPYIFTYKDIKYTALKKEDGSIEIELFLEKKKFIDFLSEEEKNKFHGLIRSTAKEITDQKTVKNFVFKGYQFFVSRRDDNTVNVRQKRLNGIMEP
jgi:hypothetical protein